MRNFTSPILIYMLIGLYSPNYIVIYICIFACLIDAPILFVSYHLLLFNFAIMQFGNRNFPAVPRRETVLYFSRVGACFQPTWFHPRRDPTRIRVGVIQNSPGSIDTPIRPRAYRAALPRARGLLAWFSSHGETNEGCTSRCSLSLSLFFFLSVPRDGS